jgi:hypothetical protein
MGREWEGNDDGERPISGEYKLAYTSTVRKFVAMDK